MWMRLLPLIDRRRGLLLAVPFLAIIIGGIVGLGWGQQLLGFALCLGIVSSAVVSPLLLIVFPIATTFWVPLLEVGSQTFTLGDATLVGAAVAALIMWAVRQPAVLRGSIWRAVLYVSLYTLTVVLGAMSVGQPVLPNLLTTMKRVSEFALLVPSAMILIKPKHIPWVIAAVLSASIGVAVISVQDYMGTGLRTGGPLFYANVLGLYAAVVWNLAFSVALERHSPTVLRGLALLSIVANVATLAVSGSRSATLGLLLSAVWWLFKSSWSVRTKLEVLALAALAIGLFTGSGAGQMLVDRFRDVTTQGTDTIQVAARLQAQQISMEVFAGHPIIGVGITGLPIESLRFATTESRAVDVGVVNNSGSQWAQVLAESGVLGFIVFSLLLLELYRTGVSPMPGAQYADSPEVRAMGNALAASVVTCIGAGVGMHTLIVPFVSAIMWLEAACVASGRLSQPSTTVVCNGSADTGVCR